MMDLSCHSVELVGSRWSPGWAPRSQSLRSKGQQSICACSEYLDRRIVFGKPRIGRIEVDCESIWLWSFGKASTPLGDASLGAMKEVFE